MTRGAAGRRAYSRAGVDVGAGERAVELMRASVESTRRDEVVGALGGFAGTMAMPAGYREPLLVAATDGVGTKSALAAALGRYDTIGHDLVAMCADDVACLGAEPLFLLDYLAVGRVVPEAVAEIVASVASGCREAGCALIGGETAEHPGILEPHEFDLAGCCVGVVERADALDGGLTQPGDVLIGLEASGLHANGFALVRGLIAEWDLDLQEPYQQRLRRTLGEATTASALAWEPGHALATLGDVLLTPTPIYARALLAMRRALRAAGWDVHGLAHVTGGGLPANVPRALRDDLAARIDVSRWRMPSVMRLIGALGGLDAVELRASFNGGIGMVAVVPPAAAPLACSVLTGHGVGAVEIGEVAPASALAGTRYVEIGEDA